MIRIIRQIIQLFLYLTLVSTVGRLMFYLVHHDVISAAGDDSMLLMLWHGLRLDVAVSGYLTIFPAIIMTVSVWLGRDTLLLRLLRGVWRGYCVIASLVLTLALLLNTSLYSYWGFPLDSTPLFYFLTSPRDAAASIEWWQTLLAVVVWLLAAMAVTLPMWRMALLLGNDGYTLRRRALHTVLSLLLTVAMIIPIRGGFSVAANNVGSVYFSNNIRLNHAAVNPVFSFLESMTHEEDFGSLYRFMPDDEASQLFSKMTYTALRPDSCTDHRIKNAPGTRVVVVILESFSSYIMTEAGHVKGVTPTLDSLSREGIYFTNFYANSFRTDRGLVSILSGYPAQPTMSLMKYPHKTNNLYSIASSLHDDGYRTQYIYGGDANFTNMRSYLMATGFQTIVSETDFPQSMNTGKWGVNDGHLFDRGLKEMHSWTDKTKNLMVVQTSSSHEPFDVPCHQFNDKILNAFYYTDRELGRFVREMRKRPDWQQTLLVLVPDHLGCWPDPEDNYRMRRYHIPLILTGGAVGSPERIDTYGSQQDIAATVLAMLGIGHDEFTFSKDLFDARAPHFAFFTHPDAVGMATPENQTMTDNPSLKPLFDLGPQKGRNRRPSQAYLQKLYDDIANSR